MRRESTMQWQQIILIAIFVVLSILSLPIHLHAQSGERATVPPLMVQPDDFRADLIPGNNTNVRDVPATFYCRIFDTTEMLNMEIVTEWYINGVPYENFTAISIVNENFMTAPDGMETNLTIVSLNFISSPVPFIEVSCRTSIFPDVNYGFYEVGSQVTVGFDQSSVNGSEGNVAVVCATATFPSSLQKGYEDVEELLTLDIISSLEGSTEASDYGPLPSNISFSLVNVTRCFQIQITNDSIPEGIETFILHLSHHSSSQNIIQNSAVLIPSGTDRILVRILETCYDGEIRLRGGYDIFQGRVEICYNGVWGTVCDDGNGWQDGGRLNARVICQQLGLESQAVLGFTGAIFGPGNFSTPIYLDEVQCSNLQTNLLNCTHNQIGVHDCTHNQDVSVDCIGRSTVGAPCSTRGSIRLVGGMDEYQGRVEVCTEAGVYSTVCSDGWDNLDAQVVCQQIGFEDNTGVAAFDALFGLGVGTIVYHNFSCLGNERLLLDCPRRNGSCTHFRDAGVDCLGRPLPGVVIIGFERVTQDNGNLLSIREGETLELCVVLMSGTLPFEIQVQTYADLREKRQALNQRDFIIQAPLDTGSIYGVFLGFNVTRSCFNITAIDDDISESRIESVQFRITNTDVGRVRVLPSARLVTVRILDDDFPCGDGQRHCIDTLGATASCISSVSVCNGVPNCRDGSDEVNCTDYCAKTGINGFSCLTEQSCVKQDQVCDGIPDCAFTIIATDELQGCTDGCEHGSIQTPLLNGALKSEGLVEVCVNGTYYPVSLDNGRFTVREATVICRDLGLGNAGIPLTGTNNFNFGESNNVRLVCKGTESNVSNCTIELIDVFNLRTSHARVRCFQQDEPTCEDGMIRLSTDGPSSNRGRVEICYQNIWGAVYDPDWTQYDAAVACSQLNFDRSGALPVTGVLFGSIERVPVVLASPTCTGNETSLLDCRPEVSLPPQLGQTGFYLNQANGLENLVAVKCENRPSSSCTFLDVRLTFRTAKSTGILELCNEQRQWTVACTDNQLPQSIISVVCSQLGFDPNFVQSTKVDSARLSVVKNGRPYSFYLTSNNIACSGNETNLTSCLMPVAPSQPSEARRKRVVIIDDEPVSCNSLTQIQCGAPPRLIFTPPSTNGIYEVEVGRSFSLSCALDQNIYPSPTMISLSRITTMSNSSGSSGITRLSRTTVTLMDEGVYQCGGLYGSGQPFGENVTVNVRGPSGNNQSAYLRLSFISTNRSNSIIGVFLSLDMFVNETLKTLVFDAIPARTSGVHSVEYCRIVNRRELDVERRLDRAECKITQFSNVGEEVEPVVEVLERLGVFFLLSFFQDPVNISATGFCDTEAVTSASGTTYIWPETLGGQDATFSCPTNPDVMTTRRCDVGGVWLSFDEDVCDTFSGQLSNLLDLFNNLTTETYETAVSRLSDVIELSENNVLEQNSEALNTIANYSAELATFVDDSDVILNDTVVQDMVEVVSSLLQWNPENIATASSSRVLQSFEEVVSRFAQQLSLDENETISVPQLVIVAELRSLERFNEEGRSFTISGSQPVLDQRMPTELSAGQDAGIRLPSSLFRNITGQENVGVFFGRYETATLFPVPRDVGNGNTLRQTQVCSQVLAATVGQNVLQNLEQPVTVTLKLQNKQGMFTAPGSVKCVSWDFNTRNWTTEGCLTSMGQNGTVVCRCNHLTNFAVLADVCSVQSNCQATPRSCMAETISSESGTNYVWLETAVGEVAMFSCPLNRRVIVRRRCNEGGVWEAFNDSACGVVNERLNRLSNTFDNLTTATYEEVVSDLAEVVQQTRGSEVEQNMAVLGTVAEYLTDIATFVNGSNITINSSVVENVARIVSALLQWNPRNVVAESSSSVVQSFEVVVYLYAQQLTINRTQNFTLPSLTLVAELRSVASLAVAGRSFTIDNNEAVLDEGAQVMPGQLLPRQQAAISLPASLFESITDRNDVGVFFALYNTFSLFPVNQGRNIDAPRRLEVGSRVLAATVGPGLNFPDLTENVTVVFRLTTNINFTAPNSEMCVSWSFAIQDWTTEGCTTNVSQDGIVTCSCNHLTNFAVLVDICSRQENCRPINEELRNLLTYVSYIGMSISIVALILTILTMLLFKKLRQKDTSKYHVQLSLAMLFMLVVSLALVSLSVTDVTDPFGGCVTVSILVHYFTLVAVMWMGAEALLMFQKLVIIFTRITTKFIVSLSIVCWTVPIVLVLIPFIVELANGTDPESDIIIHRANSSEDISFCFLSHLGAFWGAFLVPIFAILILNVVVFIWVIVILVRHTKGTAARKKESVSNKTIIRLMVSISGVMFLFGLTWLFAILTFSVTGLRETFQILFTVFNSFQGFFIFLFFCIFNKEALESWKELLSCGKYHSTVLHPSHLKFSSSAATKKPKQTNTGSTGFSKSSGVKYASETSKSDYESSTITKSNIYEKSPVDHETKIDLGMAAATAEQSQGKDAATEQLETTIEQSKETEATIEQTNTADEESKESPKEEQKSTEVPDLTEAKLPVIIVHEEDHGDATDNAMHQQDNEMTSSSGKEGKLGKKFASLKARIKRYSTRKMSKHHVEEVEIDFQSDGSNESNDGDAASSTQL